MDFQEQCLGYVLGFTLVVKHCVSQPKYLPPVTVEEHKIGVIAPVARFPAKGLVAERLRLQTALSIPKAG
jgi:hypothetical protein